jgi:acylphosphatase
VVTVSGRVKGKVQGVGFRYFVQDSARLHSVAGYVKNAVDGSVEFVLQGPPAQVQALVGCIEKGPRFSKVEHLEYLESVPSETFNTFELRY